MTRGRAREPRRQRAASSAAGIARGDVEARADDGRTGQRLGRGERRDDAVDVLVRHRRGHEGDRPAVEERPQVVERDGQGGGAGRVVGAVEEHVAVADAQQLEPARPDRGRVAAPPGVGRDGRDAGRLERVERRIGDRRVGRLVPSAQADPGRPEARQVDLDPVAVPAEERRPARPRSAARRSAARAAG